MRAIIIAAGEATRWNNYLGIPKHMAPVDGEPIIYRTVRLLLERGIKDIVVVGPPDDDRYKIPGSTLYLAKKNPAYGDADKFLSSKEMWSTDDRTVVFWGDCFLTENAMDKIVGDDRRIWNIFFRFNRSSFTGCPYGEIFAHSFFPEHQQEHLEKLYYIADLYSKKVLTRCGGWEHYRAMHGAVDKQIGYHKKFSAGVEIHDFSDDFDSALDYDRFIKAWEKAKTKKP